MNAFLNFSGKGALIGLPASFGIQFLSVTKRYSMVRGGNVPYRKLNVFGNHSLEIYPDFVFSWLLERYVGYGSSVTGMRHNL